MIISQDPPNKRYDPNVNLGTWSSISQVDTFLNRFNHSNGYKDGDTKLSVGNYVTIQYGSSTRILEIAGFDVESKQKATDGSIYDNGYGIMLIPKTSLDSAGWNKSSGAVGGYYSSTMHNTHIPDVVAKLKNTLGDHIVNRNVLLSNSVDSQYNSNGYKWTKAEATLMSVGQMTGTFGMYNNRYDDGEANYKLPIFNFKEYKTGSNFWTRGICGNNRSDIIFYIDNKGNPNSGGYSAWFGIRSLIYIR